MTNLIMYLGRIGLAVVLGLFIGYERKEQKKPAGMRDIALATLGASLFTVIALHLVEFASQLQPPVRYDFGRIIAYTVVSMGFLGSGVIIQNKNRLEGITTAGTLWCAVAIGLLCGIGSHLLAVISAIAIYLILKLKHITIVFEKRSKKWKRKRQK